ncbi:MAG: hypothetical protein K2Y71_01405 [Xanthobacteraceae bacterium]|nr:hypothetical protein [Xanthobacteraceae bacterium]
MSFYQILKQATYEPEGVKRAGAGYEPALLLLGIKGRDGPPARCVIIPRWEEILLAWDKWG